MGIIIKQSIKSSMYAYIGIFLGFFTSAILMPKALLEAEVGLIRLLVSLSLILCQFANLGFNGAGSRLFPYFRDKTKQHNGYLFWALLVTTIGLSLFILVFNLNFQSVLDILNYKASPLLKEYLFWVYPLTIFGAYFAILDNYSRLLYDSVSGVFIKEFLQRILLFFTVTLFLFGFVDFKVFIAIYCIGLCLPTFFISLRLFWQGELNFMPIKGIWTKKFKLEFASLSLFTFLSGFSSQVVNYLDQIQVTSMINLDANGIYATMMMFGTVIYTPTTHISRIGGTIIAEAWKTNDLKSIQEVYSKSCITLSIIGCFLFICIIANMHNVFEILPNYKIGYWVVIWIGLGKLMDMATGVNGLIIHSSKYYYYDTFFMLFLIIGNWYLNIWLIPIYGIVGSALATALVIFIFNLFRTIFVYFVFKMFPFNLNNLFVFIIAGFTFLIAYYIPRIESFWIFPNYFIDTLLRASVITIIFFSLVYLLKISHDVNQLINKYLFRLN